MDVKELLKKLGLSSEELQEENKESEELEMSANSVETNVNEPASSNQVNQEMQNSPPPNNLQALIDYEILTGRQLFVAKYGNIENLDQMLPIIESFAYREFMEKISKGEKPSYFKCLEDAKERVVKLFDETTKQLRKLNTPTFRETKETKPKEKPFTLEDLYGEYIKNLKNITTKYNNLIHLGWKPRGVKSIERGALGLNQISEYKLES